MFNKPKIKTEKGWKKIYVIKDRSCYGLGTNIKFKKEWTKYTCTNDSWNKLQMKLEVCVQSPIYSE